MRTLRLAPVLLALAACSVDTASLKPRSDAECAALGQKVCGNRCMPITLENGCGNAGCSPCPAPQAGFEGYCDGSAPSACNTRPVCPAGSAYCEGPYDTTCDDIRSSGSNCGACGHVCGGPACNAYACDPQPVLAASANPPPDLGSDGASWYWMINDYLGVSGRASIFKDGLPGAQWVGYSSRIEVDALGAVLWSGRGGDSIWEVPRGAAAATLLFTPNSGVRSLALDPGYAYFSELGSAAAGESAVDLVEIFRAQNATPGQMAGHKFSGDVALTAVALEHPAAADSRAVVGTASGALRWLSYDLNTNGTYATGIEAPAALVAFTGLVGPGATTPQTLLFWVGETGNLFGKILPDGPVVNLTGWRTSSTGSVDLFADGDGVYWVDSGFQGSNVGSSGTWGLVGEWRASYDDVVILYLSATGRPTRVAANATQVAWIDGGTGAIWDVHK
jgi:hypothetical protein